MPKFCLVLALLTLSASAAAPTLRLPEDVVPVRYRLDLTLIPDQDSFAGNIEIDLDIRQPADVVWLNSRNLTLNVAQFVIGGRTVKARMQPGGKEFAGFALPSAIPAGKAQLEVAYHGELNKRGSGGLFKLREDGAWYIYSQFESIDARRAFPCFDEPGFKAPWQLTLHMKREQSAVSNTPVLSETPEAGGLKKIVFAETQPLPSYLVALGVGRFDFVDAGRAGKKHTPLRIVTPKGKAAQAEYAAEVTGQLLEQIENYFGVPYPYEKLDSLAIPLTFGFGAMENAGLITYQQNLILGDPAQDTIERQRLYADTAAHEIAHQWFGDLVTNAWWNDIWLNEAFASWMSAKIIHTWKPEWNTKIDEQYSRLFAMERDSLVSARKIRQPIETNDDIANAFDAITYSKGESVIRMFENWMGPEAFRRGVQHYLHQYAWRNATAGDFLDSVGSAGNQSIARPFSTFLEQPGIPLVSVGLNCDAPGGPILRLSQKRALPLGSTGSTEQTWQVPVCVRYGEGDASHRACTLLTLSAMEWKLPAAASCPAWVLANADGEGYYCARYEGNLLDHLLAGGGGHLSAAERVAVLGEVQALTSMGELQAGDALALVPQFASDPIRQVVDSAAGIASGMHDNLVRKELLPNYARFIDKAFGARARQLGWGAKAGESAETRLLRASLLPLEAVWGEDHALAAEARRLAERWLANRKAVDPDIVGPVMTVAARTGDQALFKQLLAALPGTQDRQQRRHIFRALGSFRDPEIARAALDLLLKPDFDLRETVPVLAGPVSNPETRALPFEFVQKNYDAIVAKMPTAESFDFGAFLPFLGASFCDEKSRQEVAAFFEPKVDRFTGARRNLAKVLETIRLCTAYKSAQQASVTEFLRKY